MKFIQLSMVAFIAVVLIHASDADPKVRAKRSNYDLGEVLKYDSDSESDEKTFPSDYFLIKRNPAFHLKLLEQEPYVVKKHKSKFGLKKLKNRYSSMKRDQLNSGEEFEEYKRNVAKFNDLIGFDEEKRGRAFSRFKSKGSRD